MYIRNQSVEFQIFILNFMQKNVMLSAQVPVNTRDHLCPGPGYYPYDSDCSRFYKCRRDSRGKLEGYMYECPSGYAFWEISRRCEKVAKLPSCVRGVRKGFSEAPIERRNIGSRKLKQWPQSVQIQDNSKVKQTRLYYDCIHYWDWTDCLTILSKLCQQQHT